MAPIGLPLNNNIYDQMLSTTIKIKTIENR